MEGEYLTVTVRLMLAVLAGGVIGLERSYHGRPAGFRTHTLVCTASALLMLLLVFQQQILGDVPVETITVDPTRMAQGIMTGIGFLGAGVIMKEGLTIRGLTTAGSIWITAAIGIMIGTGLYFAAVLGTLIALGTLALFRWIESIMPALSFARLSIRFQRKEYMKEEALKALLSEHGIHASSFNYTLNHEGRMFQYELTIKTKDLKNFTRLAERLDAMDNVYEFSLTPIGV